MTDFELKFVYVYHYFKIEVGKLNIDILLLRGIGKVQWSKIILTTMY